MKINKDNPFYFIWEDGETKGQIKGLERVGELLEESVSNKGKFEELLRKEIYKLKHKDD